MGTYRIYDKIYLPVKEFQKVVYTAKVAKKINCVIFWHKRIVDNDCNDINDELIMHLELGMLNTFFSKFELRF